MDWRVVVLASIPNGVVGRRLLDGVATMTPTMEASGGAQRQIVLTATGADGSAAAANAVERLRDALGDEVKGELIVQSVDPDES